MDIAEIEKHIMRIALTGYDIPDSGAVFIGAIQCSQSGCEYQIRRSTANAIEDFFEKLQKETPKEK